MNDPVRRITCFIPSSGWIRFVLAWMCIGQVLEAAQGYMFSTLAGTPSVGHSDGGGSAARFNYPQDLTVDGDGNVYIADTANSVIRKMTPEGVVTTLAGNPGQRGTVDGIGDAARFNNPGSIAVDAAGTVYVGEPNVIRRISPRGEVITLAGMPGESGSTDGTGSAARFGYWIDLAVDRNGTVFLVDGANQTIRRVTSDGVVTTLAGTPGSQGSRDGAGNAARISFKAKIAVSTAGEIFLWEPRGAASTDGGLEAFVGIEPARVRKVTSDGVVTTLGWSPHEPVFETVNGGTVLPSLRGLAIDQEGNLHASFGDDFEFLGRGVILRVTPSGETATFAGSNLDSGSLDAEGTNAQFALAGGLDVDARGNVFVADTGNHTIRKITPAGTTTTIAGIPPGYVDGTGGMARFRFPAGLATDSAGNVYVADNNIAIRRITPEAVVTNLLKPPAGSPAPLLYWAAQGLARDGTDNLYFVDSNIQGVRKVTPAGIATTLVTFPRKSESDGTSHPPSPSGVAVDSAGNVYVSLSDENTIRRITPDGVLTTLAGSPWLKGSDDGIGAAARFSSPSGIASDSFGTIYVADSLNRTIRRITAGGVVTTIAGVAGESGSVDGAGAAARFVNPRSIAIDSAGDLLVLDAGTLRRVTAGIVTTLNTTSANSLAYASHIAVDAAGNIYATIADHTVSKGVPSFAGELESRRADVSKRDVP